MARVYAPYEQVEEILPERECKERVRAIQSVLNGEEKRLRAAYPILNWTDSIAMAIYGTTLVAMGTSAYLYLNGIIPWYMASIVCGMCIGVHHEIEHDIIHNLYFKNNKFAQDFLFAATWVTKFHISPWVRRVTHWKHHRVSGQLNDVEERFVGMGEPFGVRRLFLAVHPNTIYTQAKKMRDDAPQFDFTLALSANVVPFTVWQIISKLWVAYQVVAYFNPSNPYGNLPQFLAPIVNHLMVLWLVPSILRSTSLIVLTSNSHFYADIPKNNLFYQCQILNHPVFYPFALFACDFGATHIIHHYNALQPFFIRQLCRGVALDEMRKQGVRINDWGVITRKNAFHRDPKDAQKEKYAFFAFLLLLVTLAPVWFLIGDVSFLSMFIKDKIMGQSYAPSKSASEVDDNDNKEVKCE